MTCRSRWYSATGSCFRRPAPPATLGDETRMMLCDNYCNYYYINIIFIFILFLSFVDETRMMLCEIIVIITIFISFLYLYYSYH